MNNIQRVGVVALATLVLAACAPGATPTNQAANATTTVRRGVLSVTVSSSGTVEPLRSTDLSFATSGTLKDVFVEEGQRVTQGQVLASLDPRDLDQQVVQAEANLKTSRAQLEQTKSGNATPEQLAAQAASLRNAQAQLSKAQTGGVTAADIANAEAAVRGAQAQLSKTRTGNTTPADIANAEAAVRGAQAQLSKARSGGVTAADIANAEAALRSAEARLQAAQRGPKPDQVSAAQARLTQAQQAAQKTAAATSANKTSAEQSMFQAADAVRLAQAAYETAYWDDQQARSGIDPRTGQEFGPGVDEATQQEQFAAALRQAELQLSQAQSRLDQAQVAFENAKQQEINDVATAQSQVDDAQTQLDELLKGPEATDVAQAQAAVDQARAQLQKLQQGGTAADVAAAQAQVDQAVAQLQKLRQGGSAPDIAASRAQLDQAQAQLQGLRQGGSASDIAASQAQVDQAAAQLEQLTEPKALTDIEIAEANVIQAEAQLTAAQIAREKASLTAPFNGLITAVNVTVGGSSSGTTGATSGGALTIVDSTKLHLDVSVSEADVAQIQEDQSAQVTIDALGSDVITGTVSFIAPAATVEQNVTTYLVRVDLPTENTRVRVGMTAAVDVQTEQKGDVLLVPASAIRSGGSRFIVRKQQGDTFVDTEVRIGVSNDRETEIVSGLSEGDVIAELATAPTPGE